MVCDKSHDVLATEREKRQTKQWTRCKGAGDRARVKLSCTHVIHQLGIYIFPPPYCLFAGLVGKKGSGDTRRTAFIVSMLSTLEVAWLLPPIPALPILLAALTTALVGFNCASGILELLCLLPCLSYPSAVQGHEP